MIDTELALAAELSLVIAQAASITDRTEREATIACRAAAAAVTAIRAADANLAAPAIEAEFRAWWKRGHQTAQAYAPTWLAAWTRHILTRGRDLSP